MIVSANELTVSVLKAGIGAHVPRGVAHDIAQACLALLVWGKDPLAAFLASVENWEASVMDIPRWKRIESGWFVDAGPGVCLAPSLVDFARVAGEEGFAACTEMDQPVLALGCALAAQGRGEGPFQICFEKPVGNGDASWFAVDAPDVSLPLLDRNTFVALRRTAEVTPRSSVGTLGGYVVDDTSWRAVQKMADRLLVSANAANRTDAGAGTTDND